MEYIIKTDACMKPYNCKKWWVDRKLIPSITVEAESAIDALKKWRISINTFLDMFKKKTTMQECLGQWKEFFHS